MNELKYKHEIMSVLVGLGFDVQAHEDTISNFIPDLSFAYAGADGWLELKYLAALPKTLGSIPHYTYGQQKWLEDRGAHGSGNCFLLVGSPDASFLWRWEVLKWVRDMSWSGAAYHAVAKDTAGGICRAISAVVQRGV